MGVFTKKLKGLETPLAEKWDKLKSVDLLKDDIDQALKSHDFYDFKQTLETGPQLVHTLRHRSPLRCYNQYSSQLGEIFTAHYVQGSVPKVSVWTVESKTNESTYKQTSFRTACEIWSLVYVMKHRVYLAFCKDLTLRVFTDAHSAFSEVYKVQCRSSILCLRYNKYDDEIYAGGIGTVDVWKIHGAEHAASVGYVQSIKTELTKDDWVSDIQVEQKTHHMYVMYCNGITIINFRTKTKINTLLNRHEGPMKCCCFFSRFDNLLTGGVDGKIRIFNSATLNHVHMFNAHNGPVTSLVPHMKEAVLFSSSHDGTIKLWRMDSLQPFVRLDVGERIHGLALLGPNFFFFRTDCDIMIYKLNQLYHVFASVESVTTQLMQCTATDKPSRILASAEDGSVRLFSPLTGLTLTIIYPMPTFQVFTSFAYDLHQHRLYAIVTDAKGGNVLVYNTDCNPCVPIEVWSPERPEDTVTSLVLISVEFPCEDGSNDIDNLVFAGLNNGQIILCESLKCTLDTLVKAHDGAVVGLASCSHLEKCNSQTHNVSRIMVSSGTDCYTKIWLIQVSTTGRLDLILLIKINTDCAPQHICMFDNLLCVTYKSITSIGLRWVLQMYLVVGLKGGRVKNRRFLTPLRLTHSPDEDHTKELTALDKCPVGKVILTSGKDGFVKIWSMKNNLIREINFNVPIYAACFANERGDFLVGYETHICSISLVKYLPVEHLSKLSRVLCKEKKQETREVPVPFNNRAEPCDDLQKVKTYRVELLERKRQKVEEAVLARIKFQPASTCKKFVIYVDDGKTQIIRKDVADRLLTWARGKFKLKIGSVRSGDSGIGTISVRSRNSKTFSNVNSTAYFSTTSFASVEEVPLLTVADALRALHTCQDKGPIEMKLLEDEELLKKNPIIAPDGYIPNSIIRKYLKPRGGPEAPKRIEVFKPKPVPKAVPSHMPIGWGQEEEQSLTPLGLDDSTGSERMDMTQLFAGQQPDVQQSPSSTPPVSGEVLPAGPRKLSSKPSYKLQTQLLSLHRNKMEAKEVLKKKPKKMTGNIVEEVPVTEAPTVKAKESKTESRKSPEKVEANIIGKLVLEKWMPKVDKTDFEPVLEALITSLGNSNPYIFNSATTYVREIDREMGLPEEQFEKVLGKLSLSLNHGNKRIREIGIKCLEAVGSGRTEVLHILLPKLNDGESEVRKVAAEAIASLTGAHSKESLCLALEKIGILPGAFSSKEDEEMALRMLAERFTPRLGQGMEDEVFERVTDWVQGTGTGLLDENDDELSSPGRGPDGRLRKMSREGTKDSLKGRNSRRESGSRHKTLSRESSMLGNGRKESSWMANRRRESSMYSNDNKEPSMCQDESLSRAGSSRVADIRTGSSRIADIRTGSSRIADIRTGSSGVADIEGRKNVNITGQSAIDNGRSQRQYGPADGFSNVSDVSMSKPSSLAGGRFTPKGEAMYNFYRNVDPRIRASTDVRSRKSDAMTGQDSGIGRDMSFDSTQTLRLKPFASQLSPVKSVEPPIDQDDQTGAAVDRLSNQDSGFGPDMSDISQGRRGYPYAAPLSPVKSGSEASPGTSPIPAGLKKKKHKQPEEWRKFFELPNAVERRQMEVVKREMAQGKLKQTTLPPISYFAEDLPMLPGEAGTRLLQTVRIGDKNPAVGDGRHRIESVPGRLSVHTKNEAEGNSSYGIIQMRWTTSVPTTLDPSNPPVKLPHHRQHLLQDEAVFFPSVLEKYGRPRLQTAESEDDDVRLPDISRDSQHSTYRQTPSYQWELPLPPPPAKESRTNITTLKKDHDSYCKYYALVKKKLHLYTSKQREPTLHLPEVVVRQINEYRGRTREASKRKKSREPSKLNLGSLPFLPPIKLRQLVEIC